MLLLFTQQIKQNFQEILQLIQTTFFIPENIIASMHLR